MNVQVEALRSAPPAASNRRIAVAPAICAAAAVLLGTGVLFGYLLDVDLLRRVGAASGSVSPISAVAIVLAGAAAMPIDGNGPHRWQMIPAGLLALVSLAQIADQSFGHSLGVSTWLFADAVSVDNARAVVEGKRSTTGGGAICFLAVAGAVGARFFGFIRPVQFIALAIIVSPLTALIGFAYSRTAFTGMMPPYTALALIALAGALLFRDVRFGLMSVLVSHRTAGRLARIVLPLALAVPFALDWFFLAGLRWEVVPFETSLALFVAAGIGTSAGLLLYTLMEVDRIDRRRRRAEWRLSFESDHDALTGALSRKTLVKAIDTALNGRKPFVLLHLDLDGFRAINAKFGEPAGDDLLRFSVQRLLGILRPSDLVARFGDDDFAILIQGGSERLARDLGGRIQAALARPFAIDMERAVVGAAVGAVAVDPSVRVPTSVEVTRLAEDALADARKTEANRIAVRMLGENLRG